MHDADDELGAAAQWPAPARAIATWTLSPSGRTVVLVLIWLSPPQPPPMTWTRA